MRGVDHQMDAQPVRNETVGLIGLGNLGIAVHLATWHGVASPGCPLVSQRGAETNWAA